MPAVPRFILKRLYVKNSFANTPDGCEFALHNPVGSGTLTRFFGLDMDATTHPPDGLAPFRHRWRHWTARTLRYTS